jgi:hypothetical protein
MLEQYVPQCILCGDEFALERMTELGYKVCLPCGEKLARQRKFTVAIPYNKGAYQLIYNPKELSFTNPKRTT